MTYEFNVDRFYAQFCLFSFFVISYDRGIKLGSNWTHELWIKCWQILRPIGLFFLFSLFHMIDVWNMDEIESYDFEFNVDRFYAQLGAFSIFTISHIREMKPGSNWIPSTMNLMLTDFTPHWALFLFSSIHMIEGWNLDQIESHDLWI